MSRFTKTGLPDSERHASRMSLAVARGAEIPRTIPSVVEETSKRRRKVAWLDADDWKIWRFRCGTPWTALFREPSARWPAFPRQHSISMRSPWRLRRTWMAP